MNRLIKSDLRRILRKPALYIFTIILWIYAITTKNGKTPGQQIDAMTGMMDGLGIILISIPVLLCVYGDEFKAGSFQIAIGRGISRTKIIVAKFFDCIWLTLVSALFLSGIIYIKNVSTGLPISGKQHLMLAVYALLMVVKACGYFAIASFFMMMSFSIASGMIVDLFMLMFFDKILMAAQKKFRIGVYDNLSLSGLTEDAYRSIAGGSFPVKLIPAIALIIIVVAATAFMFNRKELEL